MPELPEVQTVLDTLEKQCADLTIEKIILRYPRIATNDLTPAIHQKFVRFIRRGKYLCFELERGTLVAHLRMEGKFFLQSPDTPLDKHTHAIFELSNGKQLRFHDARKFGRIEYLTNPVDYTHFHDLGPEPFDERFNAAYCKKYCANSKMELKTRLLDQSFVAGVGNIYANEICFALGLDPRKVARTLTKQQFEQLVEQTRAILNHAIACGGTTIHSFQSGEGIDGRFQINLKVHGKQGQPCPRCHTPIEKIFLRGRGTYFCPNCQKRGKKS